MDVIFMNSGNSKTSDPHRLLPNLLVKNKLKEKEINILLYEFKISAPRWNGDFELPDGSYSG